MVSCTFKIIKQIVYPKSKYYVYLNENSLNGKTVQKDVLLKFCFKTQAKKDVNLKLNAFGFNETFATKNNLTKIVTTLKRQQKT